MHKFDPNAAVFVPGGGGGGGSAGTPSRASAPALAHRASSAAAAAKVARHQVTAIERQYSVKELKALRPSTSAWPRDLAPFTCTYNIPGEGKRTSGRGGESSGHARPGKAPAQMAAKKSWKERKPGKSEDSPTAAPCGIHASRIIATLTQEGVDATVSWVKDTATAIGQPYALDDIAAALLAAASQRFPLCDDLARLAARLVDSMQEYVTPESGIATLRRVIVARCRAAMQQLLSIQEPKVKIKRTYPRVAEDEGDAKEAQAINYRAAVLTSKDNDFTVTRDAAAGKALISATVFYGRLRKYHVIASNSLMTLLSKLLQIETVKLPPTAVANVEVLVLPSPLQVEAAAQLLLAVIDVIGMDAKGTASLLPYVATLRDVLELPEALVKKAAPCQRDGVKVEALTLPYPPPVKAMAGRVAAKLSALQG